MLDVIEMIDVTHQQYMKQYLIQDQKQHQDLFIGRIEDIHSKLLRPTINVDKFD